MSIISLKSSLQVQEGGPGVRYQKSVVGKTWKKVGFEPKVKKRMPVYLRAFASVKLHCFSA